MEKSSLSARFSRLAGIAFLFAMFTGSTAFAEWKFESITHDPAVAGQTLTISVRLKGSGEESAAVWAAIDQEPKFESDPVQAIDIAPGLREAQFVIPIRADAEGFWHINFQIVEGGIGKERKDIHVQIHETAPTPAPTPTPAATPVAATTPASVMGTPPVTPPVFTTLPTATPSAIAPTATPAATAPATSPVSIITTPAVAAPVSTPAIAPIEPPSTWSVPSTQPASSPANDLAAVFVDAPDAVVGAPGEVRALRYKVINRGAAPSSNTLVRYGSNLQSGFDRYAEPLAPGGEIAGMVRFEIDPDLTEVWVEAGSRQAADTNPADNRDSRPVRLGAPSPYEVTLSEFQAITPREGMGPDEAFEVRFQISNPGPKAIDVPFVVSLEGFEGGAILQTVNPPLEAKESQILRFKGWLPQGPTAKPILRASADVTNVLAERDESDNFTTLDAATTPPATAAIATPAATPTPATPDQQDFAILSLQVSPQKPVAGSPVLFVITTNLKNVTDTGGLVHDVAEYLILDPRGDGIYRLQFQYNSTVPDPSGRQAHLFTAAYTYEDQDRGMERHARIDFRPPNFVPDSDPTNNSATSIVQVAR